MKQAQVTQLRANLLQNTKVISFEELQLKGPKYIIDQIQYSLSDEDYDNYEENLNFRYAKLLQMDKVTPKANSFFSIAQAQKRENPRNLFTRQLSNKPRSNSPNKRSNFSNNLIINEQEKDQNTQQNVAPTIKNKRKPTIKKAMTQEESIQSLLSDTTPKESSSNTLQNTRNLRNTLQVYVEDIEEISTSLNDIVNFRIRASSFEERTCLFEYLTNLKSSFQKAQQFKREANVDIFSCLEIIKFILGTYSDQMPHQIHITLKELVKIMIEFLENNTIDLKNGEIKAILDKLIESEKVFKKYSQFYNSNQKMSEIDNSPDCRHRLNQIRFNSNPNVSITKELSSNSLNTPQTGSKAQKSKFYQQDENETQSQKDLSSRSLTRIAFEIEQQEKKGGMYASSHSVQTNGVNQIDDKNSLFKNQPSFYSINSSPYTTKITPTSQVQKYEIERRQSQDSQSPFQSLFKRRSISIASYQTQITKHIFTKVGFLLHYQKMQNYFFREEEIMKIRQHQKLRLFQHKRTTSIDPNQTDCTPLSTDSMQGNQSPLSTYSAIGGMSPFLNSPISSNSSGINQKGQKEEQFNVTILYQKVNENIDVNDLEYQNMIYILRTVRKLENESILLSKKAKRLFFDIKKQILDNDECFLQKRQFLLHKFLIWKMKRWYTQYKRQKTECKKISLYVMEKQICRICDQKVYLKHFKYHSILCKEREELKKDLKQNMKNINTEMFYFLQKSRSLGVKCQLLQKKIEKILKLQEQNVSKQLQVLRRKSYQSFNEDKNNKVFLEQNGLVNRSRNGSNSFKEYLNNQKSKNSLTSSTEKLQQDFKNSKQSLTQFQDVSCNKISEDDDDSQTSDSSESDYSEVDNQQGSLSQIDKQQQRRDSSSRRNSKRNSRQKLGSNTSLTRRLSKGNTEEIQNKENNPINQNISSSSQAQQPNQQELVINSLASIDKQNSRSDLPIINEQTEYEEDHSKPFIPSEKGIRPLGLKSNTPKNSLKIGTIKEANSVSSILCTSDEEDKHYPPHSYCPSTPNIDISQQNDSKKTQVQKLGQIVEENEVSKNPSKDENHTSNDTDKASSGNIIIQESLAELALKYEEEQRTKQILTQQQYDITQSIKSLNQQQIIIDDEVITSSQDKSNGLFQEFRSNSPQNPLKQFQFNMKQADEECAEKISQPSIQSTKQMDQNKENTQSSLGDCIETSHKAQQNQQNNSNSDSTNQLHKNCSASQEEKKLINSQENQSISQSAQDESSSLYQQVSPLPEIFEKEFKQINNSIYQQSDAKTPSYITKNGNEDSISYQIQQDSLIMNQQDSEENNFQFPQEQSQYKSYFASSKLSSQVNSPDVRSHKKKQNFKEDLQEKFSILQKSLKNNEILNEIETEFSSASAKNNPNSSKDLKNKSNNIRLQLNRLASLEATNVSSPFKMYQQVITNSEDKLSNSQNASRSSLKDEVISKPVTQQRITEDAFNFSQFNPLIQQQSSNSSHYQTQLNSQPEKNSKTSQINESAIDLEKEKSNDSQQMLKHFYPVNLRQRIISNPNPSQLQYQRENNSTSPSSASSVNGDNKQQNSVSFTQFKEVGPVEGKRQSLNKQSKKYGSPLKKNNKANTPTSNKDNKLVQDIVKLSNNFELKIKQHQLKSNHICLRIFELIQQLSKIFFIQDFQNNWKRKRIILDDNKQKIEFLLQKSMIPKDYGSKISNILQTFAHRVELLEKLQNAEKQLSKQVDDISEEIERTEDNLSNDSQATKQSNITTNKIIKKKDSIRQQYKSGTHISSRTYISKDSYLIESPTQSDQQSNPSNNNIVSQQQASSPLKNNFCSQNQISIKNPQNIKPSLSVHSSPQKIEEKLVVQKVEVADNPRFKERASSHPNTSTLNDLQIPIISNGDNEKQESPEQNIEDRKNSSVPTLQSVTQNSLLQNNKRRMSVQSNLKLEIKNKIFQKINQSLSCSQEKKFNFKEDDIKNLSSIEKFDLILKQAMQKFENDLVDFEKPLNKYNTGYFSDGNVENCYQCLENMAKKESNHQTNIDDFEFLKLISKGAFGRVWLVKKKNTHNVYATKIVNLAEKMNKNNIMSLQNERDIFSIVSGDFVVKAVYTFVHESYLCFVMEYMIGGDLGAIMQQYGVLDETIARFYIAEIILACSQLHKAGIVHRDLKPDNLLLDSKGHLKLTDFGLSDMGMKSRNIENTKQKKFRQEYNYLKRGMDRISNLKGADKLFSSLTPQTKTDKTRELKQMKSNLDVILNKGTMTRKMKNKKKFRIIGTPDYIPPEVINGSNNLNSPTLDWWSVGVILFEMLVGIPPFNDETVEKIFDNIVNMRVPWDQINIGYGEDEVTPEAEDLIKKLMDPNPSTRLGVNGVEEIQSHPFFNNFDWSNVRKMSAPVIPKVKNIFDTSNFEKQIEFADKEKIDPFYGLSKGQDEVNKAKDILKGYNFQMKRYDILFEENCQQLEEIQKKMKFMEEEIEKDEEELQKLEVEYGSDNEDSQESQPFNIPRSVITFQDLEQINNNSSLLFKMNKEEQDENTYSSLRNITDNPIQSSMLNSNKFIVFNEGANKQPVNLIKEEDLEHIVSTNSIEEK